MQAITATARVPSKTLERVAPPSTEALGEQIALLSAQIQAATYQLLVMIREFDERDGWSEGFRSCAHWLNWRTGLGLPAAREKVRVARALGDLPLVSAAMSEGTVSFSKVRALTRVATSENEADLLEFAHAGTAAHVERLVRAWRRVDRVEEAEQENLRHESRYLSAWVDEDGMVVVRGRLAPEAGAALLRALDAAEERLFEVAKGEEAHAVAPVQRNADALGLVAESALANGLDSGCRGDRYQVVVHVDAPVLAAAGGALNSASARASGEGQAVLADGQNVSAETSRRIACDAATVVMTHDGQGRTLNVGRRTRVVPTPLRRALDYRDAGCRFPGCGVKHCDAHHVEHWADGGETKLTNLLSLCRLHHRAVHEGGFGVEWDGQGEPRFFRPNGMLLEVAPGLCSRADRFGAQARTLSQQLLDDGVVVDGERSLPSWTGGGVDYQWALDGYRR
jgi:hypothetical protein